jgi:hypothetical protein
VLANEEVCYDYAMSDGRPRAEFDWLVTPLTAESTLHVRVGSALIGNFAPRARFLLIYNVGLIGGG